MFAGRALSALSGLIECAAATASGRTLAQSSLPSAIPVLSSLVSLQHFRGFAQPALAEDPQTAPTPLQLHDDGEQQPRRTRRSGVIAVKAGMTQDWDHWGARVPLTILWIDDCQVSRVQDRGLDTFKTVSFRSRIDSV